MRAAALVQSVLLIVVAAVGLLAASAVAIDWWRGLDTWFWEESTCTIEASQALERPDYGDSTLRISYRYRYRGESYVGRAYRHGYDGSEDLSEAQVLASRYPVASEVSCWVNPDEPDNSYLRRYDLSQGFWILVPLLFAVVGIGSLWLIHRLRRGEQEEATMELDDGPSRPKQGVGVKAMIALFGILLLFGAGFLIPFFVQPALRVVEARSWTQVPCEVISSGVRSHPGDDGATYSIDVLFRYEIEGREYRSNRYQFIGGSSSGYERKADTVRQLTAGTETVCWVDPDDPFEAVIERGFSADYLFGLVPLVFALIGAGGLVFAIAALRGARRDAARPSWATATSPSTSYLSSWTTTDRPQSSDPRSMILEPAMGGLGKLGCAVLIALFWNGFISLFVWQIIQQWRAGHTDWFTIIIVTPFALIGLLLLASIPHSILALINPKPRVQLTPRALQVGESAQLDWAFRGSTSRIRRLRIWLEATQTKIRSDGSSGSIQASPLDTPTIELLDRTRYQMLESGSVSFTVPDNTPPSTKGAVSIHWKLKLHGDISFWPDVNEGYAVELLAADRE